MRPIINVDLDGVVFDFVGSFRLYAEQMLGRDLPSPTVWNFWEQWNISEELWTELFQQAVHDGLWLRSQAVIPGAASTLQLLSDMEYHIRILTTRLVHRRAYDVAAEDTVRWLEINEIPYRSLALVGPGDSKMNYEAHAIIDDHLPNIEVFTRIPGRIGIVFDQPWNQDTTAQGKKVFRARGWSETYAMIREHVHV